MFTRRWLWKCLVTKKSSTRPAKCHVNCIKKKVASLPLFLNLKKEFSLWVLFVWEITVIVILTMITVIELKTYFPPKKLKKRLNMLKWIACEGILCKHSWQIKTSVDSACSQHMGWKPYDIGIFHMFNHMVYIQEHNWKQSHIK